MNGGKFLNSRSGNSQYFSSLNDIRTWLESSRNSSLKKKFLLIEVPGIKFINCGMIRLHNKTEDGQNLIYIIRKTARSHYETLKPADSEPQNGCCNKAGISVEELPYWLRNVRKRKRKKSISLLRRKAKR